MVVAMFEYYHKKQNYLEQASKSKKEFPVCHQEAQSHFRLQ
jgi:hypothetical protein